MIADLAVDLLTLIAVLALVSSPIRHSPATSLVGATPARPLSSRHSLTRSGGPKWLTIAVSVGNATRCAYKRVGCAHDALWPA